MKACVWLWASIAVAVATQAQAGTTWDAGGGGDTSLNTAANWHPDGMPAFDGSATVTFGTAGITANINIDAGFHRLVFNRDGHFTLANGGGMLSLGAGGISAQIPTTTARDYTIAANIRLTANQTWNVLRNVGLTTLHVTGAISDGASTHNLSMSGDGTLILSGNNSYKGTTTVQTNGILRVRHNNALGTTAAGTVVENGGRLEIFDGVTTAEPIHTTGQGPGNGGTLNSSGINTLSGPITLSSATAARINALTAATVLTFSGGIASTGSPFTILNTGGGTIAVTSAPILVNSGTLHSDQSGTLVMGVAGNAWGNTTLERVTFRTDVPNVFPSGTQVTLAQNATLNLNGNNQAFNRLTTGGSGTPAIVTSVTPATLTLTQTADTIFLGRFMGAVTLVKAGASRLSISNASENVSMVVSNGVLELLTGNSIFNTGTLTIADGGAARLRIGAGLNETVDRLFFGTVQQMSGTYGATGSGASTIDDTRFSGTGMLTVQSSPPVVITAATWDAGGGTGDTLINTAANWDGDSTPNLAGGLVYATFGTGGSTATLNSHVSLAGVVFNRAAHFTLTNTVSETMTLGGGGIAAVLPDATSRNYTIATPVTLAANQFWGVTNSGSGVATLTVAGPIDDGVFSFNITKSGGGPLVLSGSNSYDGVTLVRSGGIVRVSNRWALGSTNGLTRIENGAWLELSGNVTVSEPLELNGDAASFHAGALRVIGGSNRWDGPITIPTMSRIGNIAGTFLDIAGGLTASEHIAFQNDGTLRFIERPIIANPWWRGCYFHGRGMAIFAVTGNDFGILDNAHGTVRFDVANALHSGTRIQANDNGTIDLNGNSQIVGDLHSLNAIAHTNHTITSATPAQLTVTQNVEDREYSGRLHGALGLVKNGARRLTISGRHNVATGNMIVNAGTLTVAAGASLGGSTNLVVNGGTLELNTSTGISDGATLTIASGGGAKVRVAAGEEEVVGTLFFGTSPRVRGTWGASGSGAHNIDNEHFAGSGTVRVLHGSGATIITVR